MVTDSELAVVLRLRDEFSAELRKVTRQTRRATRDMSRAFNQVRSSMQRLFVTAGGFFAVRRAIQSSIGAAVSYEKQIAEVSTLIDDTTVNFKELGDELLRVGEQFGQTPEALSKGLYDAVSAGVADASNAMVFMADASKLAVAGVTDVATSVDLLTSVLNAFGLGAEGAERANDALFRTVKLGKTTIRELAGSIGRVAPAANAVGLSIEQTGAAMATLTLSGLSTEESATALRQALFVLASASDDARKAAQRLGVSISLQDLQRDPVQFFTDLAKATDSQLEVIREFVPNVRALVGVLNLSVDEGRLFGRVMEDMERAAGSTEAAFSKMAATTDFALRKLRAVVTRNLIQIGDAFLPGITKNIKSFSEEVTQFFMNNRGEIVDFFTEVGKAARTFLVNMTALLKSLEPILLPTLELFTAKFSAALAVISAKVFAIGGLIRQALAGFRLLQDSGLIANEDLILSDENRKRLDEFIDDMDEALVKVGKVAIATGKTAAESAVGIFSQDAKAQLKQYGDQLLGVRNLIVKLNESLDEATGKKRRFEQPSKLSLVERMFPRASAFFKAGERVLGVMKEIAKARDAAKDKFDDALRPDLKQTQDLLNKRLFDRFKDQDPVEALDEAQGAMAEMQRRLALLRIPEGFARDAKEIRIEFSQMRSALTRLKIPKETLNDAMDLLAVLEEAEILNAKNKQDVKESTADTLEEAVRGVGPIISQSLADAIIDGMETGFKNAREIARNAARAIANMLLEAGIRTGLRQLLPGLFAAVASGAASGAVNSNASFASASRTVDLGNATTATFGVGARGGLFSTAGSDPIPVRAMATGGITRGPEIVLRGEKGPEAVVPLPDGRTIPVRIVDGGRGGRPQHVAVTLVASEMMRSGFSTDKEIVKDVSTMPLGSRNSRVRRAMRGGSSL